MHCFHHNDHYYIFDSHSRSQNGEQAFDGGAVLLVFNTVEELLGYLYVTSSGLDYEVTPIIFEKNINGTEDELKVKLNNVEKSTEDVSIQKSTTSSFNANSNTTKIQTKYKNKTSPTVSETNWNKNPVIEKQEFKGVENLHDTSSGSEQYKTINDTSLGRNEYIGSEITSLMNFPCKRRIATRIHHSVKRKYSSLHDWVDLPHSDHTYPISKRIHKSKREKQDNTNVNKYIRKIREVPNFECASCRKFLFDSETIIVSSENSIVPRLQKGCVLCCFCSSQIKKGIIPIGCDIENELNVDDQPQQLKNLSIIDRRFVSKLHIFLTLLVLPKGGQFAQSGMAIHFHAPIQEIINNFPCIHATTSFVPVINSHNAQTFHMDINKVIAALEWLKKHNHLYEDISIKIPQGYTQSNLNTSCPDFIECGAVPNNISLPEANVPQFVKDGKLELPWIEDKPVYLDKIPFGEEMAFPYLFPNGINGLSQNRPKKLTYKQYFQHRLYHKDGRWRKDISYLLNALNMCEREQLLQTVNIAMKWRTSGAEGRLLKNSNISSLDSNPNIIENSYMFAKNIRGTAAYWKNTLMNLLAMIKCIGSPTIFLTLSANDNNWNELAMTYTGLSSEEIEGNTNIIENIKHDPLLAAIHFERRWTALLQFIKDSKIFGEVVDYFSRVEFQNRGSVHLHGFLWIKNSPDLNNDDHSTITDYIDKIISTELPDKGNEELYDLVTSLQCHHHTFTCKRGRRNICRFGFPHRPCSSTSILTNVNITQSRGRFYATKRSSESMYINSYNPTILKLWKANMDIQVVGGSTSAAYYVCSYLCKAEPDDLKHAMQDLIENMQGENLTHRCRLLKIGCCLLKNRKISAQEAAYRLSKLKLVHSSRAVMFLNTKPYNKRYKLLKTKEERDQLCDNSEDIFCHNIFDYYKCRPSCLESWSLLTFASWFTVTKIKNDIDNKQYILLPPFHNKQVNQRVKPFAIRTPYAKFNSSDYYYGLLLAHLPHRNESELLSFNTEQVSPKVAFENKHSKLDTDRLPYHWFTSDIEAQVQRIHLTGVNLSDTRLGESDENCAQQLNEYSILRPPQTADINRIANDTDCIDTNNSMDYSTDATFHSMQTTLLTEKEILEMINHMTNDQKNIFRVVKEHYMHHFHKKALNVFITGGAGVGKTYLTRCICDWIRNTVYNIPGRDPIKVCAPTGVAAHNVQGFTIHSLLSLAVQHGYESAYEDVSAKTLKKLRQRFNGVHTLVIDEISMVSSNMLGQIDKRLATIKDNNLPFGNMNLIVIGDFFQLRPVRGKFAFCSPLWQNFQPLFLDENVRQIKDPIYAHLLNRARIGQLSSEDIDLLKTRMMQPKTTNIMHMYPKIKQVAEWNTKRQKQINGLFYRCSATHIFSDFDSHAGEQASQDYIPEDDRDAGGLPRLLIVSKNSRVMLLRNIMTDAGLVNGATAYVEDVDCEDGIPTYLYLRFDNSAVGRILQRSDKQNAIRISLYSQTYRYKGRSVTRIQFPVSLCWACTIHKVQGLSMDSGVISLGDDLFESGQAYVALSRIRTIDGLYVESLSPAKIRANNEL